MNENWYLFIYRMNQWFLLSLWDRTDLFLFFLNLQSDGKLTQVAGLLGYGPTLTKVSTLSTVDTTGA